MADQSDIWTPEDFDPGALGDLAYINYEDLIGDLQKDLQLDAATDLVPGSVLQALIDQNGAAAFLQLASAKRLRLDGPFSLSFGAIAAGATSSTVYTHNFGSLSPTYFGSHDAVFFTLAFAPVDANNVTVEVRNTDTSNTHSGPNVTFWIIGA